MSLYSLARPFLFGLDPERAHELALGSIDVAASTGALRLVAGAPIHDRFELMGLSFRNRVGLAAGLDKNGAHIDAFDAMGFGFIEVGTVTPKAQAGNPRPRMFRLPRRQALINRMGFNNDGVEAFVANVRQSRYDGVLGLNIGKNAATPIERAQEDYLFCLEHVYPHARYVTVNISSPNTKNLRQLQGEDELDRLLKALRAAQKKLADRHKRYVPLVLKVAPDLDEEQPRVIAELLVKHAIDGVIATNTTVARDAVKGLPHAEEQGGLSGAPVFESSNRVIRALRAALPTDYPIIGVGGVMSGKDARAKIEAGANLVQLYTGLIYQGPTLVRECAKSLRRMAH